MDFSNFLNIDFVIVEILTLLLGFLLAQLKEPIDKIVNHDKYRIAELVFSRIDPIISKSLKGEASFSYMELKKAIREISTSGLPEKKVSSIAKFISKKFELDKVLY